MAESAERPLAAPVAYLLLVRMWSRSVWQYRTSLVLTGLGQMLTTSLDLIAIFVLYSQVTVLGGFTLPQTLYLYGTTRLAFALSDLVASGVENLADSIRLGTFDLVLIRPVSTLAQVLADQFTPKRLGKLVPATATLVWALIDLPVHWTAPKIAVCLGTILCGFVLYCAFWVLSGCISFLAVDAREVANTFTYGAEFASEYPLTIFGRPLGFALTFVLPVAFVTWQPSLYVLGHPDPFGLPGFLRLASPAAAALFSALAVLAWRASIRRYRSTGS
ncbi:ABC transporter permease [Actinospica robiniae]|uniref:ABC transporter permease n=1 Tax=Actinospica robiniae TaxID=304901 RepID=UPI00040DABC0|nr:ABC-2 family transporter protein [Actinospica robiniae]